MSDRRKIVEQIAALGVQRGGILIVHSAFSRLAPIDGGPSGLIEALLAVLGPDGTLIMPSMSDDDEHPFDAQRTPCRTMGIVADTFWRMPGVIRSDSPHAFAALGPQAMRITAPHPVDVPHGLDSPVGRAYELDAQILLLGIGHDANTTVHLAENLAGVRYRQRKSVAVLRNGRPERFEYEEVDHCCANFALIDSWLERRQQLGSVGKGQARLVRSRDVVEAALARLQERETVFLHAAGMCAECDAAWASLGTAQPS